MLVDNTEPGLRARHDKHESGMDGMMSYNELCVDTIDLVVS